MTDVRPKSLVVSKLILLGHISIAFLLFGFVVERVRRPDLNRPFETDELITVQFYTWAGLHPSGEERRLHHINDYYALPRPDVRHLAMGTYCSMGRWPEPNNHILNSLLVNFATASAARKEFTARIPALLGALVFAGAFYYFCSSILHWRAAAPLIACWAWFSPYVVRYGQTARGYSWMLAFQILLLISAFRLARRPSSILYGLACAAVATMTFLNVVSLAVDWILPVYATLLYFTPNGLDQKNARSEESASTWRRNLLVQMLGVTSVGFVFLMSHLPNIYSAAQQNGLAFWSLSGFFANSVKVLGYLFPTPEWQIFAALGVLGLILLFASRHHSFLTTLTLTVLAIDLTHFLLARRLPFERTTGYFLPLIMIGTAYLVEVSTWSFASALGRTVFWLVCAGATLLLIVPSFQQMLESHTLSGCLSAARETPHATELPTYLPFGWGKDYEFSMYCPPDWHCVDSVPPGIDLEISLFPNYNDDVGWGIVVNAGRQGRAVWQPLLWKTKLPGTVAGPVRLISIVGQTRPFAAETELPARALVFWYPDPAKLRFNEDRLLEYINRFEVKYVPRYNRYQVKLDIYSALECFMLIADSAVESRHISQVVQGGIQEFGGTAVVFVPKGEKK